MDYSLQEIESILNKNCFKKQLPRYQDRTFWNQLFDKQYRKEILKKAKSLKNEGIPAPRFSDYKEFFKSGSREAYQKPNSQKIANLKTLTLAEAIEGEGNFFKLLNDYLWSVCEETGWVLSAHIDQYYDVESPFKNYDYIDLGTAAKAILLASVSAIFADRLADEVKKRIDNELADRVYKPFIRHDDFWWMKTQNNWNSVCHNGVVTSAILQGLDAGRLAGIIKKTMGNITKYMDSFDSDGCTSEGIGYWNYGFGNFVEMADMVHRRTGGEIDFFAIDDKIEKIVEFPLRAQLSSGKFPSFADSVEDNSFDPYLIHTLAKYFNKPELFSLLRPADYQKKSLHSLIYKHKERKYPLKKNVFFSGFQWMISREDGSDDSLVLAVKGGHNGEDHNHNDVGSFIIHIMGQSMLVDPGKAPYTKDTFSSKRYEFLPYRSGGHNLPVINGCEQLTGKKHQARLLGRKVSKGHDLIRFELKEAYPQQAALKSLRREFQLWRDDGPGMVILEDSFCFTDSLDNSIKEHLYSFHKISKKNNKVVVTGNQVDLHIEYNKKLKVNVEKLAQVVGEKSLYRASFTMKGVREKKLTFKFIPVLKLFSR